MMKISDTFWIWHFKSVISKNRLYLCDILEKLSLCQWRCPVLTSSETSIYSTKTVHVCVTCLSEISPGDLFWFRVDYQSIWHLRCHSFLGMIQRPMWKKSRGSLTTRGTHPAASLSLNLSFLQYATQLILKVWCWKTTKSVTSVLLGEKKYCNSSLLKDSYQRLISHLL